MLEGVSVLGVLEPGASMAVGSTLVAVDRAVVGASSAVVPAVGPLTVYGVVILQSVCWLEMLSVKEYISSFTSTCVGTFCR